MPHTVKQDAIGHAFRPYESHKDLVYLTVNLQRTGRNFHQPIPALIGNCHTTHWMLDKPGYIHTPSNWPPVCYYTSKRHRNVVSESSQSAQRKSWLSLVSQKTIPKLSSLHTQKCHGVEICTQIAAEVNVSSASLTSLY